MTSRAMYLHGSLAEQYGEGPHFIDANSTRMAYVGLCSKLGKKFKQLIKEGTFHITRNGVLDDAEAVGMEEVNFTLGNTKELHLWPAVSGGSAVVRIVIGIVLIVVGYFVPVLAPYLYPMGASLILGGVVELLAPKPQLSKPTDQAGQNPSFLFNGTVNVTEQGGPVPVVLGRVRRASSVVLSAGLTTENLPV